MMDPDATAARRLIADARADAAMNGGRIFSLKLGREHTRDVLLLVRVFAPLLFGLTYGYSSDAERDAAVARLKYVLGAPEPSL